MAAVISMLAIGTGAQNSITNQIESIGANLLFVRSGGDAANPEPLTLVDAKAMQNAQRAPSVSAVAPIVQGNLRVSVPGATTSTSGVGVTPEYLAMRNIVVEDGQTITQAEVDDQDNVVLLGTEVAQNLFGTTAGLVGKIVRVNNQSFRVAGVLKAQGGTSFGSADNQVVLPLSTARLRLFRRQGVGEVDMIYVQAASPEQVDSAVDEISQILRSQHISNLGVDDFTVQNTQSFLDTAQSITGILTVFLGGIAGISLLVGGIGIMNIMLVSVVERTREIGLRKALGARKRDILAQFLVESLVLSISGGMLGILVGLGISRLIGGFSSLGGVSLQPQVNLSAVLLSTLFSASIGVFFGLYPANRAAQLEPVEALRTE